MTAHNRCRRGLGWFIVACCAIYLGGVPDAAEGVAVAFLNASFSMLFSSDFFLIQTFGPIGVENSNRTLSPRSFTFQSGTFERAAFCPLPAEGFAVPNGTLTSFALSVFSTFAAVAPEA